MATIIPLEDHLGSTLYPKTKIHAVYEEGTNTRLDLILGDHSQLTTSNTDLVGAINELDSEKLAKTGDGKDLTTTFTVATTEADFITSEKDSTKWGKVIKSIQTFRTWLGNLTSNFAPVYNPAITYALGKYCTYNNVTYKCTTAITVAEAWNAAKWTAVNLGNEVSTINDNLALNTLTKLTASVNGVLKLENGYMEVWGAFPMASLASDAGVGGYSTTITHGQTFVGVTSVQATPLMPNGIPKVSAMTSTATTIKIGSDVNAAGGYIHWLVKGAWK